MARRSQCSSAGDNPLDPNYLPPHYREEYRLAVDALVEEDLEGYYKFLQKADVVDFLSTPEIQYIQSSVQVPQQSHHPEQLILESGGDGSSDTYWPIHSDLDVPGLDLGWPQLHHFIGPTEVTTLVNPPEPDMPSIKEQARRLIKNAQQVIAVVMDMFTDVDIFADILNAAMRNVAVYILLDEQNADHFVSMVSNCRVNLQTIQFLRVRTVSGITYHCRSGKSFKGQMMDRFLLTDCRAVLSGNYSFMWSFEKLHRSMAHLFLGQLVTTFDEEFRILFAQSQPLIMENVLAPMEDFGPFQNRQYPSERTSLYREPRKFLSLDTSHPEERKRHSYDERMDVDWRMMALKRQETLHGPSDMYSRFPSQQPRMDLPYDQGPNRVTMLENPAFKRHSYAEGGHGRFSYPFLQQQGMPEPENQGRQLHRGQQPYPGPVPGPEADCSAYEKFWSQGYQSADQYSDPGISQEIQPSDNFDPVLNYLSSTRNVDFDQSSEKLLPAADLPFSSSHPSRPSLGQPYACQTSPTPSNSTDQKFFKEPTTDRKDPSVKQGLRNWRISSYLSAYDNPGDEGLPLAPPEAPDPFEESSNPIQQTAPGVDSAFLKIPNVREFKVPAIPRASQMPSYTKTTVREQPKTEPDGPTEVAAETKSTPTPSESSSTAEGEKAEDAEPKEPKTFRRKYNAAVPRSSRLRSSLIFSSLDQQQTAQGQQDEESDKNEAEETKLPFISKVLGQRRSATREPLQWSRYKKSNTFDTSTTETSKPDDGNSKADDKDPSTVENSKNVSENSGAQESLKQPHGKQDNSSPSMLQSKPSEAELSKTDQPVQAPKSFLTTPLYVDMSDPDERFMFFKELAAKRKAEKAAEAQKGKDEANMKPTDLKNNSTVKKEEPDSKVAPEKMANTSPSEGSSDQLVANDSNTSQSCKEEQYAVSTDSEKKELTTSKPATSLPVSAETGCPLSVPLEDSKLSKTAVQESSLSHSPAATNSTLANVPSPIQGTNASKIAGCDLTSNESSSLSSSSVEVPPFSASAALDSKTKITDSVQLETLSSEPVPLSEVQSSSSDHHLSDPGSQISLSPPTSSSAPLSTPVEASCSDVTPEDSNSTPLSSILSPNSDKTEALASVSSVDKTSVEFTESESIQVCLESVPQLTSSESPSAHVDSDISPDTCTACAEPNASSLQSTIETNSEECCAPAPSEKDKVESENPSVPQKDQVESENHSVPETVPKKSEVLRPSEDVKSDSKPSPSPSSPKSSLPNVSDVESSISDQITPPGPTPSETCSPVNPDMIANASQSTSNASPQDPLTQTTSPSKLNLTGSVTPNPVETVSPSSTLTASVGSVLSPEAEKTENNISSDIPSPPKQTATDSNETPEPASKIPAGPEPTPESATSESHPTEPCGPTENSKIDQQSEMSNEPELPDPGEKKPEVVQATNKVKNGTTQETIRSEKTNEQVRQNKCSELAETTSNEVVPPSPQSKQPKSSQSRYQSSTANVLASSNLRDDTKLLLEQISANSQSRNEATKESPVTDDEKEGEADKNAKREKERGIRTVSRGQQSKSEEERDKLLERIQSMRKERKVYSRFEMAP